MPLAFSRMMTMDALNPLQFVSALTQQTLKHHSQLNLLFTFRKFEATNLYYFHLLILFSYFTLVYFYRKTIYAFKLNEHKKH